MKPMIEDFTQRLAPIFKVFLISYDIAKYPLGITRKT
jgi:hypothetical protein